MSKKKIKDLTITECKAICCDQPSDTCRNCPLLIKGTSTCMLEIKLILENEVEL